MPKIWLFFFSFTSSTTSPLFLCSSHLLNPLHFLKQAMCLIQAAFSAQNIPSSGPPQPVDMENLANASLAHDLIWPPITNQAEPLLSVYNSLFACLHGHLHIYSTVTHSMCSTHSAEWVNRCIATGQIHRFFCYVCVCVHGFVFCRFLGLSWGYTRMKWSDVSLRQYPKMQVGIQLFRFLKVKVMTHIWSDFRGYKQRFPGDWHFINTKTCSSKKKKTNKL